MKYNVELLKADILYELEKIKTLMNDYSLIEKMLNKPPQDVPFYDRSAIGYYLHSFYNGCENIFLSVARFFENDLEAQTWHSNLLKRMKLSIPGYRPAVIDDALFYLLNDFRAFRHIFRHSYTYELDWEKEQPIAQKLRQAWILFDEQINSFIKKLEEIEIQKEE